MGSEIWQEIWQRFLCLQEEKRPSAYLLACSGGCDSMALLHFLAQRQKALKAPLEVVYIDHGWSEKGKEWGQLVREKALEYGVAFYTQALHLDSKKNAEALARKARYAVFAKRLPKDAMLLTAHHLNDQAETLLLNLFRGSGLQGLSAMPLMKTFAKGWHFRPFLDLQRAEIENYAKKYHLDFVEDPSNLSLDFQRNFLRHALLPMIEERFPKAANNIAQSAKYLQEARAFQEEAAWQKIKTSLDEKYHCPRLDLKVLLAQKEAERAILLRFFLQKFAHITPPRKRLWEFLRQIAKAKTATLSWQDFSLFLYDGFLYLLRDEALGAPPIFGLSNDWQGLGHFQVLSGQDDLDFAKCYWGLYQGSALFCPKGKIHRKPLKDILQKMRMPPLLRMRLPVLYHDKSPIWVGYLGAAKSCPNLRILWQK